MFKGILPIMGLFISFACIADQRVTVKEGAPVTVRVSSSALNRIAVEGDRIQSVKGISGQFQLDKDPHLGQIFIQPAIENKEPVHLFLTTELGVTYALSLEASDSAPESIILVPKLQQSLAAKWEKSSSYEQVLTNIIKALHNQTLLEGFSLETINQKLAKVQGASVMHNKSYLGDKLQGQRLEIHNPTKNIIELNEADFYSPGIRAIAVLNKNLQPNDKTVVYLVRDR
jgi:conjugal transfer pilus assembly protein TraK